MYLSRLGGMNDMENTIYSAEFAKQICDEYNSLTNKMNRSIKEAVSKGEYETSLLLPTNCCDHDDVVECFNQFKNLGYDIYISETMTVLAVIFLGFQFHGYNNYEQL
jgi:hypothetical protein